MTEAVNPAAAATPWPSTPHTPVGMAAQAGREQRCRADCGRPLALMNELGTIQPHRALGAHAGDSEGQSGFAPTPPPLRVRYGIIARGARERASLSGGLADEREARRLRDVRVGRGDGRPRHRRRLDAGRDRAAEPVGGERGAPLLTQLKREDGGRSGGPGTGVHSRARQTSGTTVSTILTVAPLRRPN